MKLLSLDNYIEFKCIGGKCPISCCGGWSILVDKATEEYYRSLEGEAGERIRKGLEIIDGTTILKRDENEACIFLDEKRMCSIQKELGHEALSETCRSYPREFQDVGDITICYLMNSCPEVNRLVMQRKEPINTLFDDSADEAGNEVLNVIDKVNFPHVLKAFSVGIHILQNRDLPMTGRMTLLLLFVSRFQELMKEGKDPTDIIGVFSLPEIYTLFLENNPVNERDYSRKFQVFLLTISVLDSYVYAFPMWHKIQNLAEDIVHKEVYDASALEHAFNRLESAQLQIEFEQLMVSRFFASFMEGYKRSDYIEILSYECIKYVALLVYIVLSEVEKGHICTQEERIEFYTLCARIDHSSKMKKKIQEAIRQERFSELDALLKLVN